jgi:hypothetical protein
VGGLAARILSLACGRGCRFGGSGAGGSKHSGAERLRSDVEVRLTHRFCARLVSIRKLATTRGELGLS